MRRTWRIALYGLSVGMLILSAGCFSAIPGRTNSNGDSGTILTTVTKLASQRIGALNSAEWQIFTENLGDVLQQLPPDQNPLPPGINLPTLTDQQAKAIVDFLAANNVNTFDDLSNLLPRIASGAVIIPPELQQLLEALVA